MRFTRLTACISVCLLGACYDLRSDCENTATCEPNSCGELLPEQYDDFPELNCGTDGGGDAGGHGGGEPSGGSSSNGGSGGDGGQGGEGGNTPDDGECDPELLSDGEAPSDTCGIFVSASIGGASVTGTKDSPVDTIEEAVELAMGGTNRVYLCAEVFAEAVTLGDGVELYGGFDCQSGWGRSETRTALTADVGEVPVTVGSGRVMLQDIDVTSASAITAGASSIAMIALEGTEVVLERVGVEAGDGADGESGVTPSGVGPNEESAIGENGDDGSGACRAESDGGEPGYFTCQGQDVSGGPGGDGSKSTAGGPGGPGTPTGGTPPNDGDGGSGQTATTSCEAGNDGADGAQGIAGDGATGIGVISASGYEGASGTAGGIGLPGHGGGGGGGGNQGGCGATLDGASGGGGGSGGCGGAGGLPGGAGGSSIAILSLGATLTFTEVTLVTGNGGNGGDGAPGQLGGVGGLGGDAGGSDASSSTACAGGDGGNGGQGGPGGGGLGGHSVGIAFTGTATSQNEVIRGEEGNGGLGGDSVSSSNGQVGLACDSLDFDSGTCVP